MLSSVACYDKHQVVLAIGPSNPSHCHIAVGPSTGLGRSILTYVLCKPLQSFPKPIAHGASIGLGRRAIFLSPTPPRGKSCSQRHLQLQVR